MTAVSGKVADAANALRRIRNAEINASGKIRKAAFMPRRGGQDVDGLSVSIEDWGLVELHRPKFESEGYRACCIRVSAVRELDLDVVADCDVEDPAHALITGIPDRTRGPAELAAAEHLASELAKRACAYTFPASHS
jgi:hypothetical protein